MKAMKHAYGDVEELIEAALDEIEVAPSLRERARSKLRKSVETNGLAAVTAMISDAQSRKAKAEAWLTGRPVTAAVDWKIEQAMKLDPAVVQKQTWSALARFARAQSKWQWAKLVSQATQRLEEAKDLASFETAASVENACRDLISAAHAPDFKLAPAGIQGMVFAETANLYTVCAKIKREPALVEKGLRLYGMATHALSQQGSTLGYLVVQINRGAALSCYAHLVHRDHFEKYSRDINEVAVFLGNKVEHTSHHNKFSGIIEQVLTDVESISKFDADISSWNSWSYLGGCSLEGAIEEQEAQIYQHLR